MGGGMANLKPYTPAQNNPLNPAFSVYNPTFPNIQPAGDFLQNTAEVFKKIKDPVNYGINSLNSLAEFGGKSQLLKHLTPELQTILKETSDKALLKNFEQYHLFERAKDFGKELAEKYDDKLLKGENVNPKVQELVHKEFKEFMQKLIDKMSKNYFSKYGRDFVAQLQSNPKAMQSFASVAKNGTAAFGVVAQVASTALAAYQVYTIGVYLQKVFTTEGGVLGIPASETANMVASIVGIFFPAVGVASLIANAIGNSDFMQTSFKALGTMTGAAEAGISYEQALLNQQNQAVNTTPTAQNQAQIGQIVGRKFIDLVKRNVKPDEAKRLVMQEFAREFAQAKQIYQFSLQSEAPEIAYAKTFIPKFQELYLSAKQGNKFTPRKPVQGPMQIPQSAYNPASYGLSTGGVGYGGSNTRVI